MPAEIEGMMYAKRTSADVPWHGLGNAVTPEQLSHMSDTEIATLAGIDWTVGKRYLRVARTKDDKEYLPAMTVGGSSMMGLFRNDTHECFGVVTDRYRAVQNVEMVKFFREYTDAGEMTIETVGSLKHGNIIWALAKVNHGSDFTLPGGDVVKAHILLVNSHDGTLSYQGKTVSTRVVCWNTLSAALGEKGGSLFRMRHSRKDRKQIEEDAKKQLNAAIRAHKLMHEKASQLSEVKVDMQGEVVREYVYNLINGKSLLSQVVETQEAVDSGDMLTAAIATTDYRNQLKRAKEITDKDLGRVGKSILDAMLDSPGADMVSAKNTWWGAVAGVTYYADHVAGRTRDTALTSAWLGPNDKLKTSALELALQYAEKRA